MYVWSKTWECMKLTSLDMYKVASFKVYMYRVGFAGSKLNQVIKALFGGWLRDQGSLLTMKIDRSNLVSQALRPRTSLETRLRQIKNEQLQFNPWPIENQAIKSLKREQSSDQVFANYKSWSQSQMLLQATYKWLPHSKPFPDSSVSWSKIVPLTTMNVIIYV